MPVYVSGYSDDLIEIDGDISEEFVANTDGEGGNLIVFSNGVVLRIYYDEDSYWVIRPLANAGLVEIEQGSEECDWAGYSDRATVVADNVMWVAHATAWVER